ncbi:MAG: hypothetical protein IK015_06405 [Treponema sp.]|nr:hypothetical protein [Treponema sp.]
MNSKLKIALMCVLAVLANVALSFFAARFLPAIFLDTVFAVAITFYAGLVPGLLVAAAFNPLVTFLYCAIHGSAFCVYDCLYAICGMLIVLATWFFSRDKKEFFFSREVTVLHLLAIAFSSAFLSFFAASALDTFVRPLFDSASGFSSFDNFSAILRRMNMGIFLSYLVPRIPMTLLDRIICTFAGFGIYRLALKIEQR